MTSDGEGSREMVVSYTVASPIWKTTYRVVLDSASKPFFQGWAIVDNVSDEDWSAVSLSLVSGTPVSFIQPIQPMYRYRPVIAIPSDLRLEPQVYEPSQEVAGAVDSVGGIAAQERVTIDAARINQLPLQGRSFNRPANLKPSAPARLAEGVSVANATLADSITGSSRARSDSSLSRSIWARWSPRARRPIASLSF